MVRTQSVQSIANQPPLGIALLGFSTFCFGVACILQRDFTIYWQPVPEGFPLRQPLAWLSATLLVLSGAALLFSRACSIAAVVQVCLFLAYAASWLSRPPAAGSIQPWLGIAEHLGIAVGAATVWARLQPERAASWRFTPTIARTAYGCCSIVFALAHAIALEGTVRLIPTWMPGDAVFWALVTGAGHLAVGLALIFHRLALLATRLAGLMYLCFAAFAWLPGAIAHPNQWLRWAGVAITLVMLAAVWLVGDYLREARAQKSLPAALPPRHEQSAAP